MKELARTCARVVVNGRSEARVNAAVALVAKDCPQAKVFGVAADSSTAAGCSRLMEVVPSADILINNSRSFEPRNFFDTTDADWMHFFETNVMSGVRLSRTYMKGMLARNWGRVVFISSESAQNKQRDLLRHGTINAYFAISQGLAQLVKGTAVTFILRESTSLEGVKSLVNELVKHEAQSEEGAVKVVARSNRITTLIQRFPVV